MSRAIVAILGIILIGGASVWGFSAALENAGENEVVTNETWTPDAGNVTQLDNSGQTGAYYGNDTAVYDENETLMDRGTDYRWYESNGTVEALAGGELAGDSSATISYTYQQTTSEQRALANIVGQIPRLIGVLVPLLGVALVFIFLKG